MANQTNRTDFFEDFILALDAAMKEGARAEQALRAYVTAAAERIRKQQRDRLKGCR